MEMTNLLHVIQLRLHDGQHSQPDKHRILGGLSTCRQFGRRRAEEVNDFFWQKVTNSVLTLANRKAEEDVISPGAIKNVLGCDFGVRFDEQVDEVLVHLFRCCARAVHVALNQTCILEENCRASIRRGPRSLIDWIVPVERLKTRGGREPSGSATQRGANVCV
ncbi:hypothetical protein BCR44DRAFT_36636 [Catenaria anguillulae PL171]|uniref:Uncharacterized protein n=1 Tax=Catenaria anguillulae PL171 TaxID=765915 RepID=A0A1Y2HLN4_9FUNG|nr:hypothetical protein BCR44DRAFT_36636 [Catenaria anguillulae PL171]